MKKKKGLSKKEEKAMMQSIIVTLSNGVKGIFTGKAIAGTKEVEQRILVSSVLFTTPREIPDGYLFEEVPDK